VTGCALVEKRGADLTVLFHHHLKPDPSLSFNARILQIADQLGGLVESCAPDEAAVEDLFHAVNTKTALQLAHLRGAIILELARRGVSLFTYAPRAVKKAVTGVGSADKRQVRIMIERLLRLDLGKGPDDVSDALAVAVCHAHSRRLLDP
jgi:crossover junction endodeoxyribonuclease RuvC